MQNLLTYFIVLLILSIGVAGLAKLIMITIEPGAIFRRWHRILIWLDRRTNTTKGIAHAWYEFTFKSMGGCDTCLRQRMAEITFAGLSILWAQNWHHGVYFHCHLWLRVMLQIGTYLIFCGLVMFWGQIMNIERKQNVSAMGTNETFINQVASQPKRSSSL